MLRDCLGRKSQKCPILCQVERKILTQSVNQHARRDESWMLFGLHLQKCHGCTEVHCSRCLALQTGHFSGRPACKKCMSLATGNYSHDYLAQEFTVRELRRFLSGRRVPIDGCTEKHDLIGLVMQLRRASVVRAEEEERSRHVSQLRVITSDVRL